MSGPSAQVHPSQAPERGRLARLLGRFHVTGVFWYRFHRWGVTHAPAWSIAPLIRLFTLFFFCSLLRIRRAIAANLVPVLGPAGWLESQRRIYRTLLQFAWCLTERYEHLCGVGSFEVEVANRAAWDELAARGTGFVVLTAHIANWEVASALLAGVGGRPVHLVREQELDPDAQAFLGELLRERGGVAPVTHFAGDPLLGAELARALQDAEIVALQGDRPRAGGRTVTARLFDRPFALPMGPIALARATGVPLLPVFATRLGRRRYRLEFGSAIAAPATPDRAGDVAAAAARVGERLAAAIRQTPHQWFCFREVWDAAPASEAI